jgi:hypothetical protein
VSTENRKPIIIAAAFAVIAVVIFALGAGFGGQGIDGASGWKDRLDDLQLSSALTTAELSRTAGDCTIGENRITVPGSCELTVAEFGGPFSLQATKRTELVPTVPVTLVLAMEGNAIAHALKAGCQTSVVVGRSGGTLTFSCNPLLSPCLIELGQGPECSDD